MANEVAMTQEQNLTVPEDRFIKDSPEDLLLAELNTLREQNLTHDRVKKIIKVKIKFSRCYIAMAYSFFGLSRNQLKTFNLEKRKTLGKLIFNCAKPIARAQILLAFLPLIGWGIMFNALISFNYRRLYKKLVKMCGADNYLDNEILNKAINGDYESRYYD